MESHRARPSTGRTEQKSGDQFVLARSSFVLTYADTDPAGILYFAALFPWMERLQSEWFLAQGLRQDRLADDHGFWTVNCRTECDYLAQAQLFDRLNCSLRLGRVGRRSFTMEFDFRRATDGAAIARARITLVTVSPKGSSVEIPSVLAHHLESWSRGLPLTT
ncbi:acyl-CoA thioesterase [Rhodococcoides fascians]|uniref:acyl-CoA thioesterase n=1 Tax=Rhodococcoides fascians TaxID=1828 RepID=UPI00068C15C4|nr:acyl-CoA thioesterase [Rhodococcus fascians]